MINIRGKSQTKGILFLGHRQTVNMDVGHPALKGASFTPKYACARFARMLSLGLAYVDTEYLLLDVYWVNGGNPKRIST